MIGLITKNLLARSFRINRGNSQRRTLFSATALRQESSSSSALSQTENNKKKNNTINAEDEMLKTTDFFGVSRLFTVADLFNARVHLGHTVRSLDPRMRSFVYGSRFDMTVFDLDQTANLLRQALNFLAHIAAKGGIILLITRQPQTVHLVERTAVEIGEYAHCRPWQTEVLTATEKIFGGQIRLPDCVIFLHTKDGIKYSDHQAIIDFNKALVPTVGIVDSDCNPNLISYPVPGNDDTIEATQLYLHLFKQAILLGKQFREKTDS